MTASSPLILSKGFDKDTLFIVAEEDWRLTKADSDVEVEELASRLGLAARVSLSPGAAASSNDANAAGAAGDPDPFATHVWEQVDWIGDEGDLAMTAADSSAEPVAAGDGNRPFLKRVWKPT